MSLKSLARGMVPTRWHLGHYCPRYLNRIVKRRTGLRVRQGPFRGLRYLNYSLASVYVPKLLGIYERELHLVIEEAVSLHPVHVIDIGAAEGYYAVGMARRIPDAQVTAFEMEEAGRHSVAELARLNEIEVGGRLSIHGKCEPHDLRQALHDNQSNLVICDVEGYEAHLLDLSAVPELVHAHILVELHDFLEPEVTDTIRARFCKTHHIEHIWQQDRSLSDFPFRTLGTCWVPRVYIENELTEFRPARMSWFWMKPQVLEAPERADAQQLSDTLICGSL